MSVLRFIISPVAGSIIGYFTNWLAIKMLFRPHTEQRFLGMRVPFTPGLIPKEKLRLSKKIGMTIGEHLLTEEVLVQSLTDPHLLLQLESLIEDSLYNLQNRQETVDEVLESVLKENKQQFMERIEQMVTEKLMEQLKSPKLQAQTASFFTDQVIQYLQKPIEELPVHTMLDFIGEFLGAYEVEKEGAREKIETLIKNFIREIEKRDFILEEIMTPERIEVIEKLLKSQMPRINSYIMEYLTVPSTQIKLKGVIEDFLNNNVGKLALMFVNVDRIYESLLEELRKYLQQTENQEDVLLAIKGILQDITIQKISVLIERIPVEIREEAIEHMADWLSGKVLNKESIQKVVELLKKIVDQNKAQYALTEILKIDDQKTCLIREFVEVQIHELINKESFQQAFTNMGGEIDPAFAVTRNPEFGEGYQSFFYQNHTSSILK